MKAKLNKMKRNPKVMLKVYIVTSLIMFVSIFTGIPKVLGVTLTIWILNLAWIMYLSLGERTMNDLLSVHEAKVNKLQKDKKYIEFGVRSITLPLYAVGLIIAFINVVILFVQ